MTPLSVGAVTPSFPSQKQHVLVVTYKWKLRHLYTRQVGPDGQDLEKVVGEAVRAAIRTMRYGPE